ncbi:MAG: TraB/GumN family protein [Lentisphaeria bacterium]|nr:TraB/GumN family protein [Lentisphaeria bacterium]
MKRLLSFVLLLFTLILAAGDKVLIWEASAPGLPGKAYLAGSIHSGKAEWYPLDAAYDRAFDAASTVYFEIYKPDLQEATQKNLILGMFHDGRTLSQVLGMNDFQQVCKFYAQFLPAMKPMMLERFRPWMLSVQISQFYLMQHPEIRRECGLESVFTKHIGSKTPGSLETIDSQLESISRISDAAAGRLLMEGVREFANAGKDMERIFRALETGEPAALTLITDEMAFKHPEFHRVLFVERNRKMVEKIYSMLKQKQTVFILVGAGHFAGKENILELLRDRGCTTIQLKRVGKPGRLKP